MLWRALGHVRDGYFIDVGAAWPVQDSVTRLFKDHGWRGINIEPNPDLHRLLVEDRPDDVNLAVAVADEHSTLVMDIVTATGLSTLSPEIGGKYRSEGRDVGSVTVEVVTLAELWREHVPADRSVQFLKVDVEGFESQVLAGADWEHHRPWVVLVEATRPTSQVESHDMWEPSLVAAGYVFAYADGINRFYVAAEHPELMDSFRFPPNVFDGFILAAHEAAERRSAVAKVSTIEETHRAEVLADALMRVEAQVVWLQSEWDASESRLERARSTANELHRRIGGLDALIGERERALASTTDQLHAALHRAARFEQVQLQVGHHAHQEALLRAEVDRLLAVIANLERHIGDMYASTSWRFAKPVRLASLLLRSPRQLLARVLRRPDPPLEPVATTPESLDRLISHSTVLGDATTDADLPASASELLARLTNEIRRTAQETGQ